MKHVIVGTAGHIDHGKTALITALTGTNTDRLKEEQQRGITIDLGFASLALPNGIDLGIIDVPGHERFVKNMLAGVGGIDLALLVIAADEGVMPQTREHLAICDLLQIQRGLVALTKVDLVDEEWQELVVEDIRDSLAGTFLEDAPIVPVSSKTGDGLENLQAELANSAEQVLERRTDGVFRLPVDRVFTIKGFGTVVTGTLISGTIAPEQTIEVLPQHISARIRNIQVHDTNVDSAYAGQRTALNLHGIEKQTIQRGSVLSEPGLLRPTYMLDASLKLLSGAERPLKNRSRVRVYCGTNEVLARVVLLDREELHPGDETYAQLRLEASAVVMAGDRYIVRQYSPVITIGGGEILNVHPKKHTGNAAILAQLRALHTGSLDEVVEVYVREAEFVPVSSRAIAGMLAVVEQEIADALQRLLAQGTIVNISATDIAVLHAAHYRQLSSLLTDTLAAFHTQSPLKSGMAKEELRKKLPSALAPQIFQRLLDEHARSGAIRVMQDLVCHGEHQVRLSPAQRRIKDQLIDLYLSKKDQPPVRKEALAHVQGKEKEAEAMLRVLLDDGTLVRVETDLFYHHEALDAIVRQATDFLKQHQEMTVGDFKNLIQVSRKYAVPLLAYLDANGITLRKGDVRILRQQAS